MKQVSIRWRMTVWNTAAFAVVLVTFGVLVYSLLRQTHYDQLDRVLTSRFRELIDDAELSAHPAERFEFWVGQIGKHVEIAGIVQGPDGSTIALAESLQPAPAIPAPAVLTPQPHFDNLTLPGQGRLRRLSARVPTSRGDHTVMLLAELEHLDEELGLVLNTLLITIPVTLLVAAALAYFLAYKALAPVELLRQQTDEITAERLDRRLPVHNPSDELGLLAQTINSMIQRLEHSFDEVRRFTADASHELRTPIAIIRSEAELGIDSPGNPETAQQRFGSIVEECNRLASVTSQLLTLSREDVGFVLSARTVVPIAPLLLDTVESLRPLAHAKRQTLTTKADGDASALADPDRLRQVLHNLLDNAIKYTPEEGRIHATLAQSDTDVVITIEDNGLGIAPENLPRIYDRFYRVSKSSDAGDGAGLGLSIVHSIVTSFGGRVEAESTVGQGSVFRVYLRAPGGSHGSDEPASRNEQLPTGKANNSASLFPTDD